MPWARIRTWWAVAKQSHLLAAPIPLPATARVAGHVSIHAAHGTPTYPLSDTRATHNEGRPPHSATTRIHSAHIPLSKPSYLLLSLGPAPLGEAGLTGNRTYYLYLPTLPGAVAS